MTAPAVPLALLPYQQRWIGDDAPVKVCEKSRRVGLSWAEAADDSLYAASRSGGDVWYIGYNLDMAREFIRDTADWSRQYQLAASEIEEFVFEDGDEKKGIQALRISFASGNRVSALSSRPTNLRGKQGRVVIDEAAFHDDLPGLIKAAMALLMWGGSVRIISTHFGETNPFNELVNDIRAGKVPYALHRITLDEALAEGLYRRICLKLGRGWTAEAEGLWRAEMVAFYRDNADEELFCIPSQGSGVWLTRALLERCMRPEIPVLRLALPASFSELPDAIRQAEVVDWCEEHLLPLLEKLDPKRRSYFGEDFGRTGDLTVLWPAQEAEGLDLATPFVAELRNVPFRQQEQVLFYLCDRLPRFSGGALDARGNGQYLAEVAMQRYGASRIRQVMLSESWYRDNMPRLKARVEDATLSMPKDAEILDDFRTIRMVKGVAKLPDGSKQGIVSGGQRHGDAGIAAAMLVHAVAECRPADLEYQSSGEKRVSAGRSIANYMRS